MYYHGRRSGGPNNCHARHPCWRLREEIFGRRFFIRRSDTNKATAVTANDLSARSPHALGVFNVRIFDARLPGPSVDRRRRTARDGSRYGFSDGRRSTSTFFFRPVVSARGRQANVGRIARSGDRVAQTSIKKITRFWRLNWYRLIVTAWTGVAALRNKCSNFFSGALPPSHHILYTVDISSDQLVFTQTCA